MFQGAKHASFTQDGAIYSTLLRSVHRDVVVRLPVLSPQATEGIAKLMQLEHERLQEEDEDD